MSKAITGILNELARHNACCSCCGGDDDYLERVIRIFKSTPREWWPPIEGTDPFHNRLRSALQPKEP
jgi:hypothetical protein